MQMLLAGEVARALVRFQPSLLDIRLLLLFSLNTCVYHLLFSNIQVRVDLLLLVAVLPPSVYYCVAVYEA